MQKLQCFESKIILVKILNLLLQKVKVVLQWSVQVENIAEPKMENQLASVLCLTKVSLLSRTIKMESG